MTMEDLHDNDLAVGQVRRTGMGDYATILAMDGGESWVKFHKTGRSPNRKVYPNSTVARWPIAKPPIPPQTHPSVLFIVYQVVNNDQLKVIRIIAPEFTRDFNRVLYRELQRPGYLIQAIRTHSSTAAPQWYDLESYEEDCWDEDMED